GIHMKKMMVFLSFVMMTMLIAACGESGDNSTDGDDNETITIEHELGTAEVPKNPEKVVVFDYGTLDTLDALGIDVAAVSKMNVPSYLDKYDTDEYENAGTLFEPDFEKLSEIDPDVIFISGRQSDVYEEMEKLAPTVYLAIDTSRYMDSFKENLDVIADIFDKHDEIDEAYEDIEKSIEDLKATTEESDKNALIILANDDKISAYGPSSRFGIIHDVFGVPAVDEGIEASTHGMNVTFEYVVEQDPDLLYVIDRGAVVGGDSSAKQLVENKLMEDTKSYKNDHIFYLDPDFWYLSGGGLESVNEMIDEIGATFE
ncbi:MAG TPA: siderophore ABC transporter substrate-binding protein, partial [Bacillota bacterium]|nr:siderophore ABC transporter substrate-binding protein [Bacillota bacterium]